MKANEVIKDLSIEDLFNSGNYFIPIYQRNYAWGEKEINQLIRDIFDFYKKSNENDYHIGTLIIYDHTSQKSLQFETIDGQQRLTTITILYSVLHREFKDLIVSPISFELNLDFESRPKSSNSLKLIADEKDDVLENNDNEELNESIINAYFIIKKEIESLLRNEAFDFNDFYIYLSNQVKILSAGVPHDTDRNHYFEIMNTRGEQLEKHEILKSDLMSLLNEDDNDEDLLKKEKIRHEENVFNKIWEACSEMSRYVQYGFFKVERDVIFCEKYPYILKVEGFDEICKLIKENNENGGEGKNNSTENNSQDNEENSIDAIINLSKDEIEKFKTNKDNDEESPDRFNSIINFPNFLLHVLKIQTEEDISLDDKLLLEEFQKFYKSKEAKEKIEFVKTFSFNLLKIRLLFDQFIIKRDFFKKDEPWSLMSLRMANSKTLYYSNTFRDLEANKKLTMLLSMFHESTPTLIYKNWLNGALYYCFQNFIQKNKLNKITIPESDTESKEELEPHVNFEAYISYLENLAKSFFYDRYIAIKEKEGDKEINHIVPFFDIIYKYKGISRNACIEANCDWDKLNKGTAVENFVFNYLDYILWNLKSGGWNKFVFRDRSSVEHYYPQNPIVKEDKLSQEIVDMFGNLCLISSSKNSTLGRYMPDAKKNHYIKVDPDSLKQEDMMKFDTWGESEIKEQTELMMKKIKDYTCIKI